MATARNDPSPRTAWRERVRRYREDFETFAREQLYVRTKPPNPRIVPMFPLFPAQRILQDNLRKQEQELGMIRHAFLKSRQQGGSTLSLSRLYHRASLWPNISTFTAAHNTPTAINLFRTVRLFHERLAPQIRPTTRYASKTELVFENPRNPLLGLHSTMMVDTAKNIHIGTSRTLTCLHLSEVARYSAEAATAIGSVLGAIPVAPGTIIIMESTAFITGAYFKDLCERAERQEGFWRFTFVPWFQSPEYAIPLSKGETIKPTREELDLIRRYNLRPSQIKWRRAKLAEYRGEEILFKQDFPSTVSEAWIVQGYGVFSPRMLERAKADVCEPRRKCAILVDDRNPNREPVLFDCPDGTLWIWKEPMPGMLYDLAADVALEEEEEDPLAVEENVAEEPPSDYSTIQIIARGSLEQVAEWRGRVAPIKLAEICAFLGYRYNTAQIAVESRGIGVATTSALSTVLAYPNLYRWRYRDRVGGGLTKYLGWDTTWKSKQYLIAFALSVLSTRKENAPLIHSQRLYDEMRVFVRVGPGQYQAAAGYYDDLVMAWLIALVTSNDEDFSRFVEREEKQDDRLLDKFAYEPGRWPRPVGVDPACVDVDADDRLMYARTEVDGW